MSGELKTGEAIPSVRSLAKSLHICLCGYFVLNWLCGCTHCKFCLIYSVSTICIWFLSLYVLCFICTDIIVFGICFAIKLLVRC